MARRDAAQPSPATVRHVRRRPLDGCMRRSMRGAGWPRRLPPLRARSRSASSSRRTLARPARTRRTSALPRRSARWPSSTSSSSSTTARPTDRGRCSRAPRACARFACRATSASTWRLPPTWPRPFPRRSAALRQELLRPAGAAAPRARRAHAPDDFRAALDRVCGLRARGCGAGLLLRRVAPHARLGARLDEHRGDAAADRLLDRLQRRRRAATSARRSSRSSSDRCT